MPDYDFVQLGEGLAANLLQAAEDQVSKAQTMLDQTQALAKILRDQVHAQAQQDRGDEPTLSCLRPTDVGSPSYTLNGDVTSTFTDL